MSDTLNANEVGPYPHTEDEVTADTLIRYYLLRVQWYADARDKAVREWIDAERDGRKAGSEPVLYSNLYLHAWTVLAALKRVCVYTTPQAADEFAKELYWAWESEDEMYCLLRQWKRDAGIDPDARIVATSGSAA